LIAAAAAGERVDGHLARIDGTWKFSGEASELALTTLNLLLPVLGPTPAARPLVIGHIAQSLDGRIALPNGVSQWISGEGDLTHTHRLRALADAVVVGANTAAIDDPQLTVRRVDGSNPVRVILDPTRRLSDDLRVFSDGAAETIRVCGAAHAQPEDLSMPLLDGVVRPSELLVALHERGMRRVLVEGGGRTVSHFLAAGVLDRLHLVISPIILGEGLPSLHIDGVGPDLSTSLRPQVTTHRLDDDLVLDCAFGNRR